ncbi:outer membrane protein assembly factor BamD [Caldichromatium japonicum]|uniref:Outer membrane protein assembly factor BamD n=1 Tax=Caldichromatium japonicum TaxID=2699430 RepID=A0A6G7VDB8_9GAMM|nr:outer membrane protein assembly factor BamD [Caldichromatium japonicum]QIK37900.1 outer membrane protein assembly factor BamD [Caldichromatium japonicum]
MPSSCKQLAIVMLAALLAGCGVFGKKGDETEGWSAAKLYAEASAELKAGSYQRAIELYEKLEARYPFGRYAMQAQLDVAYAHYRADEPEEALAAADRFIKLYPQNPYVDYAYYLKGIINYNRGISFLDRLIPTDASQRDPGAALDAFKDFAVLVERFPNSKYAEDARQRMVYLRNNLAMNEVHVARYYLKRGAYLAAANRANHVIQHYQRTSAVDDALEVLIAAYRALGKDDLAADAQRVLDLNRQAGRFAPEPAPPERPDLLQRVWEALKLDED